MERFVLEFHKDVFRFIYFLVVTIPQYIGMALCTCHLIIGTIINFLFCIDHPFVKMGLIAKELREEDEALKKTRH